MLYVLGLDNLLETAEDEAPPEAQQLLERAAGGASRTRTSPRADEIRDELAAMGWVVRDTAEGAHLVPRG